MKRKRYLVELSTKRIKLAQKKYTNNWKKLSDKDLIKNIEEELADTISYISFFEKIHKKDLNKYKLYIEGIHMLLCKELGGKY